VKQSWLLLYLGNKRKPTPDGRLVHHIVFSLSVTQPGFISVLMGMLDELV
jgi:hypothetical protein